LPVNPHLLVHGIQVQVDYGVQRPLAPGFRTSSSKAAARLTCVEETRCRTIAP
jgi:hypothetical protein